MDRLEQHLKKIYPKVYAFYLMRTEHKEAAEDLTQEVFYQALKGTPTFAQHSSLQTWIFSIARNQLKKYYRSKKYKAHLKYKLASQEKVHEPPPEEQLMQQEHRRKLVEKIRMLDELAKEVVILRVYGELSFQEIGNVIGRSENYARVIFHRAKLKLQKEWGE